MSTTDGASASAPGRLHDAITGYGFSLAAIFLCVIVVSFCYEVVARYFFAAPTEWASPMVSYSLASMIFLGFPELTRRSSHISINILLDASSPSRAAQMMRVIRIVAAFACLMAAWFSANETINQFNQDIWTSPPFAVPKWLISMFVPYGMLSSGIYFLRQLIQGAPVQAGEGVGP